ncbi:hypothetical protein QCM77_03320 [Bradyrhizobium sp. SSUT18]|uniref:hypothetical protein n=1 Tax=Bradyrhizobium sp. SSUT18 TaxID=3040602 RepID=UPI0024481A26|nr:hypothetical protein [Bradyrhizobium sp. SSUT18]MDH2399021.1 hypothetical protein [Bradyrhizobium sp. SSUT18]
MAEAVAGTREGLFCLRIVKAKARADVCTIDPPVDLAPFRNAGGFAAQQVQLFPGCVNDQAIILCHECCPQNEIGRSI